MIKQLSRVRSPRPAARQGGDRVSLTLPKNEAFFSAARLTIAGFGMRAGLSYEAIEDLKIIVTEACTYCMKRGRNPGRLHITLDLEPGSIVVSVADPAFELASGTAPKKAFGEYEPDELFVIRNLADELVYRMRPGAGLRLRITKSID